MNLLGSAAAGELCLSNSLVKLDISSNLVAKEAGEIIGTALKKWSKLEMLVLGMK